MNPFLINLEIITNHLYENSFLSDSPKTILKKPLANP